MGTLSVDKLMKTSTGAAEFTLPATDGTAGQSMITDGAGQLSLGNPTVSGIAVAATTLTASGATTLSGATTVSGAFTSLGIDDNADANAITIDASENVIIGDTAVSYSGDKVFIKGNASGADAFRVLVRNVDTTSTANSTLTLSTNTATGGDPRILFNIDSVANVFTMGVDNSDSDMFKISYGQTLGTTDRFRIDSAGVIYAGAIPGGGSGGTYDMRWISAGDASYFRYDSSSQRYKLNIVDINFDTSPLYNLRPVSFDEKPLENPPTGYAAFTDDFGLIAEEVHTHMPKLVTYKDFDDGNGPVPDAVNYSKLSVILLNEIQKLNTRITALEAA